MCEQSDCGGGLANFYCMELLKAKECWNSKYSAPGIVQSSRTFYDCAVRIYLSAGRNSKTNEQTRNNNKTLSDCSAEFWITPSVEFTVSLCCCCCWVTKACLTLPPHRLQRARLLWPRLSPEFAQIHGCWVSDATYPSHLLLLPYHFAINLSKHQAFSSEPALCIEWPKYWSFSFSISPSNEYSGLISFRIDWFDFLAVKSLLQRHNLKASILRVLNLLYGPTLTSIHDYWKNHSFDVPVFLSLVYKTQDTDQKEWKPRN